MYPNNLGDVATELLQDLFLEGLQALARNLRREPPTELVDNQLFILTNLAQIVGPCEASDGLLIVLQDVAPQVHEIFGSKQSQGPLPHDDGTCFVPMCRWLIELDQRSFPAQRLLEALNAIASEQGRPPISELQRTSASSLPNWLLVTNLKRVVSQPLHVGIGKSGETLTVAPQDLLSAIAHLAANPAHEPTGAAHEYFTMARWLIELLKDVDAGRYPSLLRESESV